MTVDKIKNLGLDDTVIKRRKLPKPFRKLFKDSNRDRHISLNEIQGPLDEMHKKGELEKLFKIKTQASSLGNHLFFKKVLLKLLNNIPIIPIEKFRESSKNPSYWIRANSLDLLGRVDSNSSDEGISVEELELLYRKDVYSFRKEINQITDHDLRRILDHFFKTQYEQDLEMAASLLAVDIDYFRKTKDLAFVISGEDHNRQEVLSTPVEEIVLNIVDGLKKEGYESEDIQVVYYYGPDKSKFNALLRVLRLEKNINKIAFLAHGKSYLDAFYLDRVYLDFDHTILAEANLTLSNEEIASGRYYLFSCAAIVNEDDLTSGTVSNIAREYSQSGNYLQALSNSTVGLTPVYKVVSPLAMRFISMIHFLDG